MISEHPDVGLDELVIVSEAFQQEQQLKQTETKGQKRLLRIDPNQKKSAFGTTIKTEKEVAGSPKNRTDSKTMKNGRVCSTRSQTVMKSVEMKPPSSKNKARKLKRISSAVNPKQKHLNWYKQHIMKRQMDELHSLSE